MIHRNALFFLYCTFAYGCATYVPPNDPTVPYTFPNRGGSGNTSPTTQAPPSSRIFINNKFIKLGIDPTLGGAMTYLSEMGKPNMVNNFDYGRQIQNSLYSGPTPYGKPVEPTFIGSSWNPVQAGDYRGTPAQSMEWRRIDSTRLYVKSNGIQWHLINEPGQCVMEHWYEIRDNTVRVRSRTTMVRPDTAFYNPMYQETPAVYLNSPYRRFVYYGGPRPFSNDALTVAPAAGRPANFISSECWAALVDEQNYGLGIYNPKLYQYAYASFGVGNATGEFDDACAYMTGLPVEQIDYNGIFEYEYTIVVGSLDQIRQTIYAQPRPQAFPNFLFNENRQGWSYFNTRDQGWPIRNALNVHWEPGPRPELFRVASPFTYFSASNVPKLYVQAAFSTGATSARFIWTRLGDNDFRHKPNQEITFPITGDGQMRVYEIDLSQVGTWQGQITRMALEPTDFKITQKGGRMRLRSVTATRP